MLSSYTDKHAGKLVATVHIQNDSWIAGGITIVNTL